MELVRYHTPDKGVYRCLIKRGRKWIQVLMLDRHCITVRGVKMQESRFMETIFDETPKEWSNKVLNIWGEGRRNKKATRMLEEAAK